MRILFTGGAGKAGRHVIPYLLAQGHVVLNVDLLPLDHPGVENRLADITDAGQMFDALSSYASLDELDAGAGAPPWSRHRQRARFPAPGQASGRLAPR